MKLQANPLRLKVGMKLVDEKDRLVEVAIYRALAGIIDVVVQGVHDTAHVKEYTWDSHDYDGEVVLPTLYHPPKKSRNKGVA